MKTIMLESLKHPVTIMTSYAKHVHCAMCIIWLMGTGGGSSDVKLFPSSTAKDTTA